MRIWLPAFTGECIRNPPYTNTHLYNTFFAFIFRGEFILLIEIKFSFAVPDMVVVCG